MFLGIDIGSVSTNAVLMDKDRKIIGYEVLPSGYSHRETAEDIIRLLCEKTDTPKKCILYTVGTGYGRGNIPGVSKTITEITCHAAGVHFLYPDAEIIIDIGGQDSKVIWITENGLVDHFIMNDKCSAGTGRFLEVMAGIMKMDLEEFSTCGLSARGIRSISSTCTVFAESEVISAVTAGTPREEIAAGIYASITERILAMSGLAYNASKIVITGGVAKNNGVVQFMKRRLSCVELPYEPQITGAIGAAILGWRYFNESEK